MYHGLSIYKEHSRYVPYRPIINKTTESIQSIVLVIKPSYLLENDMMPQSVIQNECACCVPISTTVRVPVALHTHQHLLFSGLFHFSPSIWGLTHCDFNFHFLWLMWLGNLSWAFFASIFSCELSVPTVFHIYLRVFFFFMMSLQSKAFILETSP